MPKKNENISKAAGFAAATTNAEIKTHLHQNSSRQAEDHPVWFVRALRWTFITAPRAVWNWICNIEIGGLVNLAMLLLIIVLFSILIGQVLNLRCDRNAVARNPEIINIPKDNVEVSNSKFVQTRTGKPLAEKTEEPTQKETIVLPLKRDSIISSPVPVPAPTVRTVRTIQTNTCCAPVPVKLPMKAAPQKYVKIDGDVVVDGDIIGKRLDGMTQINGNLVLQNLRAFTLPCGIKINGNLIIRNVRHLRFCGSFTVNGDIYVSADSSFGPIPQNAKVRGQVIF